MINDGYTQELAIEGQLYRYRPLPRPERVRLLLYAKASDTPMSVVEESIQSRLSAPMDEDSLWRFWKTLLGMGKESEEIADEENLRVGVELELLYPHITKRPCGDCREWWYNHESGMIVERGGKKLKRPPHTMVPCETTGCIKGTPDNQRSLSPKNRLAYQHYLECKATCSFPDDPIVRRNAVIIREVEDRVFLGRILEAVHGRRSSDARDRQLPGRARPTGPVLQPGTKPYRRIILGEEV